MTKLHPLASALAALALVTLAQPSLAITWQYLGPYNSNGVPLNMVDLSAEMPAGLLADIHMRLPETKDIRKNDPKLITDDLGANINLLEDAEITVAYVHEGAGYRNAVGYFTYDPANKPKTTAEVSTRIMFPNFSEPLLRLGDAVQLGRFKAGSAVGFTIVSNGWTGSTVNPNQSASNIFYSLKFLNPEPDGAANLKAHTVLMSKPEDELLILGFEDLNRTGGDHDFNDVLIAIKVTPFSAVDRGQMPALSASPSQAVVDTDGDTIPDNLDAFPTDPARAARRFYPNATGFGFLAFEDLWPKKGDFDMNDLVMAYRVAETLNASNQITDIKLTYEIRARGAGSNNGFGVHFPGLSSAAINPALTTLSIRDQAPVALPVESGQSEAVFILSPNVTTLTATGQAFPCSMMNTVSKCARSASVPMVAEIHFQQPLSRAQLGEPPYNPFIYRTEKRGLEVHLVDHPPTAKADPKLFNTLDDRSNAAEGRYYRTADNQPWVLDVPENWRHPSEWMNITGAYPDFPVWALSEGTMMENWYVSRMAEALLFK